MGGANASRQGIGAVDGDDITGGASGADSCVIGATGAMVTGVVVTGAMVTGVVVTGSMVTGAVATGVGATGAGDGCEFLCEWQRTFGCILLDPSYVGGTQHSELGVLDWWV